MARPGRKSPRLKAALLIAVPLICGAGVIVALPQPSALPQFAFLNGHTPVSNHLTEFGWGLDGPVVCGHGVCSDSGPPSVSQQIEYTFKADYQALVSAARSEVLASGGHETEGGNDRRWEIPDQALLIVSPVRFDPKTGNELKEPGWVRVTLYGSKKLGQMEAARRGVRNFFARFGSPR